MFACHLAVIVVGNYPLWWRDVAPGAKDDKDLEGQMDKIKTPP